MSSIDGGKKRGKSGKKGGCGCDATGGKRKKSHKKSHKK